MSAWAELTVEVVRNALPTDLGTLYASWVDANPTKANRLSELVGEVRRTFRQAVEANPANRVGENPNTVPSTGFPHALNLVIFQLGMEMSGNYVTHEECGESSRRVLEKLESIEKRLFRDNGTLSIQTRIERHEQILKVVLWFSSIVVGTVLTSGVLGLIFLFKGALAHGGTL